MYVGWVVFWLGLADSVRAFAIQLTARESIRSRGLEFHRHYAGSTACVPAERRCSPASTLTARSDVHRRRGQAEHRPGCSGSIRTRCRPGDRFRAGGYRTTTGASGTSRSPTSHPGLARGAQGLRRRGQPLPEAIEAYRKADRLDRSGSRVGSGASRTAPTSRLRDVRDGVFAEQVVELFGDLAASRAEGPWLTVASFVNPHDIAFSGFGWEQMLRGPPDDTCRRAEAPSQSDPFTGRPVCQEAFKAIWPQMIFETATDLGYGGFTTTY